MNEDSNAHADSIRIGGKPLSRLRAANVLYRENGSVIDPKVSFSQATEIPIPKSKKERSKLKRLSKINGKRVD
jgi:hypothetical protein